MSSLPNIVMPSPDTADNHRDGIGDSFPEKLPSPCNSKEHFFDVSEGSSNASCPSFKAISKAWKNREKTPSSVRLESIIAEMEDLKLDEMVTSHEAEAVTNNPAKRLSLCVMMEGRSLQLTDSSEESIPKREMKIPQRYFDPEEIRQAFAIFKLCDENNDSFIELPELKLALERLSVPQTHLAAKEIMAEVVGANETKMNFCQFLLTYAATMENRKREVNTLKRADPELSTSTDSVDVSEVGVKGAKLFFEAKIAEKLPPPTI
ncbi:EF-hand domain-containing protein D2 homolog [Drosophila sulfurigaster albostrigata]|uniref:EF-hand domain-containing protein D2 homolog n=1 Tax=Drosophila sulfurigaster albostrigata TaxID=89887 RepID=UPI002D219580|nr:EF-hand domain-containing protein D2 homolog [Drosophila sulfurigaster albostrigata]